MNVTIEISEKLNEQLRNVSNVDGFIEEAIRREFNRQQSVEKIRSLAQKISARPAAKSLSDSELESLLNAL